MAKSKEKSSEWGITVFPGVDSKTNGLQIGLNPGLSILKECKDVNSGIAFLKYMSSDYHLNYVMKNYQDYDAYSCNQTAWKNNLSKMDGFTSMMYNQVLSKAQASDIASLAILQYSAPSTYITLLRNSIDKILQGKVEIKAELDSLQKKVAAQTKKN
jgi:ABC-type glycerol-3-phosphate transport system substrate-binding protein